MNKKLKHGDIVRMLEKLPEEICSTESDCLLRSPVLTFSFGPKGVTVEKEVRVPRKGC